MSTPPFRETLHSHRFVETYDGLVGFGLDRETDESTMMVYLQKFSDDTLASTLISRMEDAELEALYGLLGALMKKHLTDAEYHLLFLREEHP